MRSHCADRSLESGVVVFGELFMGVPHDALHFVVVCSAVDDLGIVLFVVSLVAIDLDRVCSDAGRMLFVTVLNRLRSLVSSDPDAGAGGMLVVVAFVSSDIGCMLLVSSYLGGTFVVAVVSSYPDGLLA